MAIVIGLAVLLVLAVLAGVWLFRFRPLSVRPSNAISDFRSDEPGNQQGQGHP